jgi:hypothetical protein
MNKFKYFTQKTTSLYSTDFHDLRMNPALRKKGLSNASPIIQMQNICLHTNENFLNSDAALTCCLKMTKIKPQCITGNIMYKYSL